MSANNDSGPDIVRGRIPRADRIQRLLIGGALMLFTLIGLYEQADWTRMIVLALQFELLATGIVGWCPVYWACRTGV